MKGRGVALMAWRRPGRLILLLLVAPFSAGTPAAAEEAPGRGTITYYVHGFTDANDLEGVMNESQPVGETPQTGTCQTCAGNQPLTYTFVAERGLGAHVTSDRDASGRFTFYIRPYRDAGGAPVYPGATRVQFRLERSDGVLVGSAEETQNPFLDAGVWEFSPGFTPATVDLPVGTILKMKVTISSSGSYHPGAAPYGVSPMYPFSVSLPILLPGSPGGVIRIDPENPTTPIVGVNQTIPFRFAVTNLGPVRESFNMDFRGELDQPNQGLELEWDRDAPGMFDQPAVTLDPGERMNWSLEVSGRKVGNWSFDVKVLRGTKPVVRDSFFVDVRWDGGPVPRCPFNGNGDPHLSGASDHRWTGIRKCLFDHPYGSMRVYQSVVVHEGSLRLGLNWSKWNYGGEDLGTFEESRDDFYYARESSEGSYLLIAGLTDFVGTYAFSPAPLPEDASPASDAPPTTIPVPHEDVLGTAPGPLARGEPSTRGPTGAAWLLIAGAGILIGALGSWLLARRYGP